MPEPPPLRIGIDLGGTKIEIIALGPRGETLARKRIATPRGDYEATLRAIEALVREVEERLRLQGAVGVAIPGAVSPATGLIKNANSTWIIGKRLHEDLSRLLRRPVRLTNDANCFALSEAVDGAGQGADVVFGVILGTGCGGGIVVGGRVLRGKNAIAGEWGHNPLPWPNHAELPGARCYCGRYGCIETWLSGPGMARDHAEATGQSLTAAEIARAAAGGDTDAQATLQRYENRLARALASVINILDPDVIVLGGGLSNIGRLYENVPKLWARWVFSDRVDTRLLPPRHGDASGVRGAAWLHHQDD
jgi:fructokinase